ncbi:MAG: hypothetical protein WCJ04_13360 [Actinomycetes bacterium]
MTSPVSDIGQKTNDRYINELYAEEYRDPLVGEEAGCIRAVGGRY